MKAKELLKCLVKSGILTGQITKKEVVSEFSIIEGKILSGKEYFYTFQKVGYIEPSAVLLTTCGERAYMYQI